MEVQTITLITPATLGFYTPFGSYTLSGSYAPLGFHTSSSSYIPLCFYTPSGSYDFIFNHVDAYLWKPEEIITWTMMYYIQGPRGASRCITSLQRFVRLLQLEFSRQFSLTLGSAY